MPAADGPRAVVDAITRLRNSVDRPIVVGIDGRSASGKSTLAQAISTELDSITIVHTDDIAWWQSYFAWVDDLVADVLAPLRTGTAVTGYRPPGWVLKGRDGSLDYLTADVILVEGVGSTQQAMLPYLDLTVWVEWDRVDARRRGLARDTERFASEAEALADWESWQTAEVPFLDSDRPWERADIVVLGGTP